MQWSCKASYGDLGAEGILYMNATEAKTEKI